MRNEKDSPRCTIPDLKEIVLRAESGDESAIGELRTILDCPEIWSEASRLEHLTREMWIGRLAGKDLFRRATIERRIAEIRWEMAGPDSSALEWLLVDGILCAWLAMLCANAMSVRHQTGSDGMFRLILEQQNAAERYIQDAVKQLATIRKLLSLPTKAATVELREPLLAGSPTAPLNDGDIV